MTFKTIKEAEAELTKYIPLSKEMTGRNITLKRMRPLMTAIGNPETRLKVIHVAGTSGKTSTTYFIASLLTAAGKKTGMSVSPHIDSVAERVQINMKPLAEFEFCDNLSKFINIIEDVKLEPTYFELLIAFAYWYFDRAGVDYAVVETGLGGLHDGTNVAARRDKLCIITDIGFDHMHILGNSISEIAAQKAGIIHKSNEVLMYQQADEIQQVFEDKCRQEKTPLHAFKQDDLQQTLPPSVAAIAMPEFQKRNWLLAYAAFEFLCTRDGIYEPDKEKIKLTSKLQVPGRMDRRTVQSKTIIMDGAHNQQKMEAFVASFKTLYPGQRAAVLLSMKEGKEYREVLPLLSTIASKLIVCGFSALQDTPLHSGNTVLLASAASRTGFDEVIIERNPETAYFRLLAETDKIGIITGSFYLIGQLRRQFKELRSA